MIRAIGIFISAVLAGLMIGALCSFLVVAVLTYLWNIVVPFFGGPSITYWVAYAGYWLVALLGILARGGVSTSKS
jgi:hypothetical protein